MVTDCAPGMGLAAMARYAPGECPWSRRISAHRCVLCRLHGGLAYVYGCLGALQPAAAVGRR